MEETSVTKLFGYLNTCKRNTVYLENVNFIFISRKRLEDAYNNRIYKQKAIFILDERPFIILIQDKVICTLIRFSQGLSRNQNSTHSWCYLKKLPIRLYIYFFISVALFNLKSLLPHLFLFFYENVSFVKFYKFLGVIINYVYWLLT